MLKIFKLKKKQFVKMLLQHKNENYKTFTVLDIDMLLHLNSQNCESGCMYIATKKYLALKNWWWGRRYYDIITRWMKTIFDYVNVLNMFLFE